MPQFSRISKFRLQTCHEDLQILFNEVIKYFDCTILEGYRTKEAQEKAFKDGKSKLHYPFGKHNKNPSMAVDVAPYPLPKWKNINDFIYFGGKVLGIAEMLYAQQKINHKISYGGDWGRDGLISNDSFGDYVHYQLIGE